KDSTTYLLHFYQDGLGMPDRDYYLKDDKESLRVRSAYQNHIEKMHVLCGMSHSDAQEVVKTVMRIETALAKVSMTKEDARDREKVYHKFSVAKLGAIAPHMDWKQYFAGIGGKHARNIVVMQPDFMRAVDAMLADVAIDDWKTYFAWHLLQDTAGALTK